MACDAGLVARMRDDLGGLPGLGERKMFGGVCFLQHGNMVCGVHKGGALYRVGKAARAAALALPGTRPMTMGARTMGGFVELPMHAAEDHATRRSLTDMALSLVVTLPPK